MIPAHLSTEQRKVKFSCVQVRYHQLVYESTDIWSSRTTLSDKPIHEATYTVDEYSTNTEKTYRKKKPSRGVDSKMREVPQPSSSTHPLAVVRKLFIMALIYYFTQRNNNQAVEATYRATSTTVDDSMASIANVPHTCLSRNDTTMFHLAVTDDESANRGRVVDSVLVI